jgi:prolyl 4-hydroxylase
MASEVDIPDATAITPWLYVGAQECVALERRELLMEKGVTHVVSVQKVPQPWLVGKAGTLPPLPFEYLHIKVEDTLTANIASHFETIDAFLASAKAVSGRAIVHCAFGQSRSVTALVSHLMLSEKLSLGEALECVRSRRPKACPNKSFLAALVRLELKLFENAPSDLRRFPSLPKHWAFVEWPCPLRQNTRFVSCHGRVMRVRNVSKRPNVSVVTGFLTPEETDAIVRTAAPDLHPSLVVRHGVSRGEKTNQGEDVEGAREDATARDAESASNEKTKPKGEVSAGRTSWNCRVSATHPAVRGAIQRAAYLSKVLPSHAEPAQVVRYLPGQKYNEHHDFFDRAAPSFAAKTRLGGQRLATVLAYLREPDSGGRTSFPKTRVGFDPRKGDALLWWNLKEDGKEDVMTLHAGEPVVSGEKWALNLWLRERPNRAETPEKTETKTKTKTKTETETETKTKTTETFAR